MEEMMAAAAQLVAAAQSDAKAEDRAKVVGLFETDATMEGRPGSCQGCEEIVEAITGSAFERFLSGSTWEEPRTEPRRGGYGFGRAYRT